MPINKIKIQTKDQKKKKIAGKEVLEKYTKC